MLIESCSVGEVYGAIEANTGDTGTGGSPSVGDGAHVASGTFGDSCIGCAVGTPDTDVGSCTGETAGGAGGAAASGDVDADVDVDVDDGADETSGANRGSVCVNTAPGTGLSLAPSSR